MDKLVRVSIWQSEFFEGWCVEFTRRGNLKSFVSISNAQRTRVLTVCLRTVKEGKAGFEVWGDSLGFTFRLWS